MATAYEYRAQADLLHAKAERQKRLARRAEFESLAQAYGRLAKQAEQATRYARRDRRCETQPARQASG